jgi:hypothetical protein
VDPREGRVGHQNLKSRYDSMENRMIVTTGIGQGKDVPV